MFLSNILKMIYNICKYKIYHYICAMKFEYHMSHATQIIK